MVGKEVNMTDCDILSKVDHTALSPTLTWAELKTELDFASEHHCARMAIAPNYVRRSRDYFNSIGSGMGISSCVSFPRGDASTETKVFEIEDSLGNGASEIDAVVNQCEVKNRNWDSIDREFKELRKACGRHPLKIIIETSELNDSEIIRLCRLITDNGIDYVKTSTGFSKGGATVEGVRLTSRNIGPAVRIKASGGIRTREDAVTYLELGVARIGTRFTREFISE